MSEFDELLAGLGNRDLLVRMLTYAIRCPAIAEVAMAKLDPVNFNEATQSEFVYTWLAARVYWHDHGSTPPMHVVRDVAIQAMQQSGYTDPILINGIRQLVDEIYAFNEDPWNVAYGRRLLNAFFDIVYIENLKQFAMQMTNRHEIQQLVTEQHHHLQVDEMPTMAPFGGAMYGSQEAFERHIPGQYTPSEMDEYLKTYVPQPGDFSTFSWKSIEK